MISIVFTIASVMAQSFTYSYDVVMNLGSGGGKTALIGVS